MTNFRLQVITQAEVAFDGEATSIIVPGEEGYFGVLAHHAPLLASLGKGTLTVRAAAGNFDAEISGGFIEVQHNQATILADTFSGDAVQSTAEAS